ncbi:MAG: hypothetical protein RL189_105 [Pseudomonadota bacterium]
MPKSTKVAHLLLSAAAGALMLMTACGAGKDQDSGSRLQSGSQQTGMGTAQSIPLINDEITATISTKIKDKCAELHSASQADLKSCQAASDALSRELDFDYIRRPDGNSAFVFMSKRLQSLLSQKEVSDYLNEVQRASLDAIYANQKFNLWDFTLAHAKGNEEVALERIAVLFQDGAQTAAQKKFLLVQQHPMAFVLGQTIEVLETGLAQGKITAYPSSVKLTRTAHYHYFVPRFLAQRIKKNGHGSVAAARLPFLFNSLYELRQIQKAQNPNIDSHHKPVRLDDDTSASLRGFIDKWNRFDELYSDLLDHLTAPLIAFNAQGQNDNLEDLYLGYAGALHGSGRDGLVTYSQFVGDFSKNPAQFLSK